MQKRIYKPPHFRDSENFYNENYRFEISIPVWDSKIFDFSEIFFQKFCIVNPKSGWEN